MYVIDGNISSEKLTQMEEAVMDAAGEDEPSQDTSSGEIDHLKPDNMLEYYDLAEHRLYTRCISRKNPCSSDFKSCSCYNLFHQFRILAYQNRPHYPHYQMQNRDQCPN